MLESEDYGDLDFWSVTDISSCSSDVDEQDDELDDHRMDHSRTVSWDPGIADSRTLSVCYDCLCLMTLFRTVMYLARYWAMRIVWTGPDEGSGRSMAWREQYLPRLYPPCVVDLLLDVMTECVSMIHVNRNNSGRRYARVHGVSLEMFSAGRISLTLTGLQHQCGWFG